MTWNTRNGDKIQQAAQIAQNDIEKSWGGTAYARTVRKRGETNLSVQAAHVKQENYGWTVSTFHPWFTDAGEYVSSSGSGIGTGFATEADAVAVAKAVIKADWS